MERPRIRPEEKERKPAIYEIIKREEKGSIRWTGMRFQAEFLPMAKKWIKPPFEIAPITFKDSCKDITK